MGIDVILAFVGMSRFPSTQSFPHFKLTHDVGAVFSGFSLNDKAINMRSSSSNTESIYLDCRDEVWQAEIDITTKHVANSTKFPMTRCVKLIIDAVKKGSPPVIWTG